MLGNIVPAGLPDQEPIFSLRGRQKAIHQSAPRARIKTSVVCNGSETETKIISVFIQTWNLLMKRTPIRKSKTVVKTSKKYEK